MSWRKLFRRGLTVIFILASLLTAVVVAAAIQIFDGTGQYIMSDFENHDIAKQRAQQRAERDAQKQAGVYLTTFSRSINATLTNDEISAVTNNIIKVSDVKIVPVPFETNGEAGLMYRVTLKASIDPEGIYDFIKRDDKEKVTIVQQNNGLQDAIAKNDALIEDLKEQYKRATSQEEKNIIIQKMKQADREFLAIQKLEEGDKQLYFHKNYEEAIKLYNEAMQLKPDYTDAYKRRGYTYYQLGHYDQAIADYNLAIKLNPNDDESYSELGWVYEHGLKNLNTALENYNKAIKLSLNNPEYYLQRAELYYDEFDDYRHAMQDFQKILELKEDDNRLHADAYFNLGLIYQYDLKDYKTAIEYYSKYIEVKPNRWLGYKSRGKCYETLGETAKAQADFAKAKKLGWKG